MRAESDISPVIPPTSGTAYVLRQTTCSCRVTNTQNPITAAALSTMNVHDTRNTAVANAYAALEAGATSFESSVAGIGGCPFAPRATGNVATEDLVYLFHGEGIETGVDLDALVGVAEWLAGVLGRELPGRVYRAGASRAS